MSDSTDAPVVETETAPEATAVPIITDDVAVKLEGLGLSAEAITKIKDDLGVKSVGDLDLLTEQDLKDVGVKPIEARKVLANLKPTVTDSIDDAVTPGSFTLLPQVPNYSSLLQMLKVGGVLRIDPATVVAGLQARLADRAGLYGLNKTIADKMLAFAKKNRQSVDPAYYKLKREIIRTGEMAELFSAIEGFDGRSVTMTSRKELFTDIDKYLLPAVADFWGQLDGWMQTALAAANGPAATQRLIKAMAGGVGGFMPSGASTAPTTTLREYVDKVNDAANQAFAGEGTLIASAALCQANALQEILQDPTLPAKLGAANPEQMLLELGIGVTGADTQVENDLVQFVMAVIQAKNLSGGNAELQYFDELWQLGNQIPWARLGGGRSGGYSDLGATAVRGSRL